MRRRQHHIRYFLRWRAYAASRHRQGNTRPGKKITRIITLRHCLPRLLAAMLDIYLRLQIFQCLDKI